MARWSITLKDPTTALPDLTLTTFGAEGYQRAMTQQITLRGFSQYGAPILDGLAPGYRFSWQIAAQITDAEALLLEALIHDQQARYATGGDGHLLLLDEMEYLPPAIAPHPKTIISGTGITVNGRSSGFGQFKVFVALPNGHRSHAGLTAGDQMKLIQFGAVEVP